MEIKELKKYFWDCDIKDKIEKAVFNRFKNTNHKKPITKN